MGQSSSREWWLGLSGTTEQWGTTGVLKYIATTLNRLETHMSELTDKVDVALATLAQDVTDAQSRFDAATAAQVAATALVQSALDAAKVGETLDEAELQKALDGLNAANAALVALGQPPVVTPPVVVP